MKTSTATKSTRHAPVITESSGARSIDVESFLRSDNGRDVLTSIDKLTNNAKHLKGFESFTAGDASAFASFTAGKEGK